MSAGPGFWATLFVLLRTARLRARGRRSRQQALLHNRTGKWRSGSAGFGFLLTVAIAAGVNGGGAYVVQRAVAAGERVAAVPVFDAAGFAALPTSGLPPMLGSLALLLWSAALVFGGEGLELDVGRRRPPMWDWLFSHPAPAAAVFGAEMLAPVAANPVFWSAPLLPGLLYGGVYGARAGVLAAVLVGVPVLLAAACLGKALEIAVTLRASPRSRGALTGIMSWLGYSASLLVLLAAFAGDVVPHVAAVVPASWAALPWPWLGWFLGQLGDGSFSFALGVATCGTAAAAVIAGSAGVSVWGIGRGLGGGGGAARPVAPGRVRFGRHALFRKELLWFTRDRSALVQVVLAPLTMVGLQLFNMRGLLAEARGGWNYLCGAGVLAGAYFLYVIGPRSLASEGGTLWIALTWPQGLEALLAAKARLWTGLASIVAGVGLGSALWLFPDAWPEIALVGVGWLVFARSMAAKAVTLAQVVSASGEAERIPWNRRWAVTLGMLTFAIGVFTRQAPLAVTGIVYSVMTAAAMWQNFRARLPFLLDPWSERLPPPPTLMHAMIAISALVELGAVLNGAAIGMLGRLGAGAALALGYGVSAAVVSVAVANFLRNRGVENQEVWFWGPAAPRRVWTELLWGCVGAVGGVGLGLLAYGYVAVLPHVPWAAELLRQAQDAAARIPHLRPALFVVAVLVAPAAEEYLFRGLLFRALDREWGGWRAVAGSAVFFASYHPVLSWLPVGLLGALNAVVFKRTGRLAPAVALHTAYNAVVFAL